MFQVCSLHCCNPTNRPIMFALQSYKSIPDKQVSTWYGSKWVGTDNESTVEKNITSTKIIFASLLLLYFECFLLNFPSQGAEDSELFICLRGSSPKLKTGAWLCGVHITCTSTVAVSYSTSHVTPKQHC